MKKGKKAIIKKQRDTRIDYLLPIGLSTLEIVCLFFIFLIYWGLGNGNIKYIYAAIFVTLVTYIIMFYTTLKFTRKMRIKSFLIIGVVAFFFVLLSLLGGEVISYTLSFLFYDIAEFLAVIFVLGLGFLIGNILLMLMQWFRR